MAAQKLKTTHLQLCEKCGSIMITRMIAERNGNIKTTAKLIKIQQCIVCRHWYSLE